MALILNNHSELALYLDYQDKRNILHQSSSNKSKDVTKKYV